MEIKKTLKKLRRQQLCRHQLLVIVRDEVDKELWLGLRRRVDDHSVRVVTPPA
jgi:hypothetical protein